MLAITQGSGPLLPIARVLGTLGVSTAVAVAGVALAALTLGLAPFFPGAAPWEKLKLLAGGNLSQPVGVFDLILHAMLWGVAVLKAARAVHDR